MGARAMKISELMGELEEAAEDLGEDAEVRVAYQPSWPLRATLRYITVASGSTYDEDEEAPGQEEDTAMVWLAVGDGVPFGENPYAPRWAWQGGEAG